MASWVLGSNDLPEDCPEQLAATAIVQMTQHETWILYNVHDRLDYNTMLHFVYYLATKNFK